MYSAIKIGGFALGIAACLLIALFIRQELTHDLHYPEGDRISASFEAPCLISVCKESPKQIDEKKNELKKLKSEFFDGDGNINAGLEHIPGAYKMVRTIVSQSKSNSKLDYLIMASEYYDKFSKYEHLGDLTYYLTHRPYHDEWQSEGFSDIYHSINVVLHYEVVLISAFKMDDSSFNSFKELKKDIEN